MRPFLPVLLFTLIWLGCPVRPLDHACEAPAVDPLPPSVSAPESALGTTSQALLAPNPLSWRRYASGGHGSGALFEAMECATTRILAATCVDIDITIYPSSNMVRWEAAANMPNGSSGYVWGSSWDTQRIKLSDGLASQPSFCDVLTHEMIHQLRQSYSHPGLDGSMSHPVTRTYSSPRSRITAEDITRICAKQACGCNVPEPPGEPVTP